MGHPLADAILDLREKSKLAGTYISNIRKGVDKDGRFVLALIFMALLLGVYQVVEISTIKIFHEITKTSKSCSKQDQDTR